MRGAEPGSSASPTKLLLSLPLSTLLCSVSLIWPTVVLKMYRCMTEIHTEKETWLLKFDRKGGYQGDQIWRTFASWAIDNFGQFFENYRSTISFWAP
jgi:hypothetical protein